MEWLSLAINVILIIWVASLQIKASRAEKIEPYDPVTIIKRSTKNIANAIKPFLFAATITILSVYNLYIEFSDTSEITRLTIFRISLLSCLLAVGISSFFIAWYWAQTSKLILSVVKGLSKAFSTEGNNSDKA